VCLEDGIGGYSLDFYCGIGKLDELSNLLESFYVFQLEKLISTNYFLNMSAKEAFKAYVRAYDSHHLKVIFDVETLDLAKVAKSFGFTVPPAVDLKVNSQNSARPRKRLGGGGYGYYKEMNQEKLRKKSVYKQPHPKKQRTN